MRKVLIAVPLVLVFSVESFAKTNEPSKLRVANLAPDVKAVDVLVDGKMEFKDVSAKSITNYVTVPAGKHDVKIVPAGKTEPVLAELSMKVKGERIYTLALSGLQRLNDLRIIDLTDESGADAQKVKVRFVNLSPDAASVDVVDAKGEKVFKKLSFLKSSGYTKLTPGEHSFSLYEKGKKAPVLSIKDLKLTAGQSYTIFAIGEVKGKSLTAVHVMDGVSVSKATETAETKASEPTKQEEPVKKVEPAKKAEPVKKHSKVEHPAKAKVAPTTQKTK